MRSFLTPRIDIKANRRGWGGLYEWGLLTSVEIVRALGVELGLLGASEAPLVPGVPDLISGGDFRALVGEPSFIAVVIIF